MPVCPGYINCRDISEILHHSHSEFSSDSACWAATWKFWFYIYTQWNLSTWCLNLKRKFYELEWLFNEKLSCVGQKCFQTSSKQVTNFIQFPNDSIYWESFTSRLLCRKNNVFTSMLENTFRHILQFNFDKNKFYPFK